MRENSRTPGWSVGGLERGLPATELPVRMIRPIRPDLVERAAGSDRTSSVYQIMRRQGPVLGIDSSPARSRWLNAPPCSSAWTFISPTGTVQRL